MQLTGTSSSKNLTFENLMGAFRKITLHFPESGTNGQAKVTKEGRQILVLFYSLFHFIGL
jgi:hypothetical protein